MADSVRRVLENEYAQRRMHAEMEKDRRREEVFACVPGLQELDRRRRELMLAHFRAKRRGEETAELAPRTGELEAQMAALLQANGYAPDYLDAVYRCPACRDTGVLENGKPCACFTAELLERLYQTARLEGAQDQTFEKFNDDLFSRQPGEDGVSPYDTMQQLKAYCLRYAEAFPQNKRPNLLFSGQTGTGKTFLLNCVAGRLLERGYSVLSITASRLVEVLRRAAFEGGAQLDELYKINALVIDELGMEPMLNNVVVEYLFMVINERCRAGRALLISTNLTPDQIAQRYTERIASRLLDIHATRCFRFVGDDLRLQKK